MACTAIALFLSCCGVLTVEVPMLCLCLVGSTEEDGLLKDVVFYALDSRQETILWDVKPSFVIVYDPDITFVRQLEVNASRHECLRPIRVQIAYLNTWICHTPFLCCVAVCRL